MQNGDANAIRVVNTTAEDLPTVFNLFEQVMDLQGKNGYKVWDTIDKSGLQKDIEDKLQYKIVRGNDILCIFSIQFADPFIWRDRDRNDAIYLHRIVVNPKFKGQRQFAKVLGWAKQVAKTNKLPFVRMDTWADNSRIIDYYKSFGFRFVENHKTPNTPNLPAQNRDLNVALLELELTNNA